MNLEIQMLAGNSLKICVSASSQISMTLVNTLLWIFARFSKTFCILNPLMLAIYKNNQFLEHCAMYVKNCPVSTP